MKDKGKEINIENGSTTILGVFTISENVSDAGPMRHAVIRRHQSLYIHPKTELMTPPFKFQDQVIIN